MVKLENSYQAKLPISSIVTNIDWSWTTMVWWFFLAYCSMLTARPTLWPPALKFLPSTSAERVRLRPMERERTTFTKTVQLNALHYRQRDPHCNKYELPLDATVYVSSNDVHRLSANIKLQISSVYFHKLQTCSKRTYHL